MLFELNPEFKVNSKFWCCFVHLDRELCCSIQTSGNIISNNKLYLRVTIFSRINTTYCSRLFKCWLSQNNSSSELLSSFGPNNIVIWQLHTLIYSKIPIKYCFFLIVMRNITNWRLKRVEVTMYRFDLKL